MNSRFIWSLIGSTLIALGFVVPIQAAPQLAAEPHARTKASYYQSSDGQTEINSAKMPDAVWQRWHSLPAQYQFKVDPRLLSELAGDILPAHLGGSPNQALDPLVEQDPPTATRFLVYMTTQVDTEALAQEVYASQADRRAGVNQILYSTAELSQASVRSQLESNMTAGTVETYQPLYVVNALAVEGGLESIIELAMRNDVERIEANYPLVPLWSTQDLQADPGLAEEVAAADITAASLDPQNWNIDLVDADRVWNELGIRGSGAVVAGFDTGVQYKHPALVGRYRGLQDDGAFNHNYSWFAPDSFLYPDGNLGQSVSKEPIDCSTYNYHGTHTMGTMVGDGGTPETKIGMAPSARWIAVPGICWETMSGGLGDDIGGLKAFQWLMCPTDLSGDLSTADCSRAPDVVNNSWGSSNPVNDTFRPAIQALRAMGIAPVFAAGNPGAGPGSIGTPANAPEAITVGATDEEDVIAEYSARGPSFYVGEQKPELSAPGHRVMSSVEDNSYWTYSGTSMAAPHVAGLIALMVGADLRDGIRDFSVDELEQFATASARDLGPPGPDNDYGFGRIDAFAAVKWVLSAGDLRGSIRDSRTGAGIANAVVSGIDEISALRFAGVTGSNGIYSTTVPGGDYTVIVQAWGYEERSFSSQRVLPGALSERDFTLVSLPIANIGGTVMHAGNPLAGVSISVKEHPATATESDASGRYDLLLPPGQHTLLVDSPGFSRREIPVTVAAGGGTVNIELDPSPSVLLVAASAYEGWGNGWTVNPIFEWALNQHGYHYEIWPVQYPDVDDTIILEDGSIGFGIPSLDTMNEYDVVIWAHGPCSTWYGACLNWMNSGAAGHLEAYLEDGGRLLLSGQNMGWHEDGGILFDDYLKADFVSSYTGETGDRLSGIDFLADLDLEITNAALYGYPNGRHYLNPDIVAPQIASNAGAQMTAVSSPILSYANDSGAGGLATSSCNDSYRAVYLAVGYENIGPRADIRTPDMSALMDRSLHWLTDPFNTLNSLTMSVERQTQIGHPGKSSEFRIQLTNRSQNAVNLDIEVQGNRWPTELMLNGSVISNPLNMPPCAMLEVRLFVDVPARTTAGENDSVTLSIRNPVQPVAPVTLQTTAYSEWSTETAMLSLRSEVGVTADSASRYVYALGGREPYPALESLDVNERYDVCTRRWETMAPLPTPLFDFGVDALDNHLYIVGGFHANSQNDIELSNQVYRYNVVTDEWHSVAPLPVSLSNLAVATADGKLYAIGNYYEYFGITRLYAYDPVANKWEYRSSMPGSIRGKLSATGLDGLIYVVNEWPDAGRVEIYDPVTDTWQDGPSPNLGSFERDIVAGRDGYVYLVSHMGGAERFSPATGEWQIISQPNNQGNQSSQAFKAAFAGGRLFAVNGLAAGNSNQSLALDSSFCLSSFSADKIAVQLDEPVTYTIDVQADRDGLENVSITNSLPPKTKFEGFGNDGPGARYNEEDHTVRWQGPLAALAPPRQIVYSLSMLDKPPPESRAFNNSITFDARYGDGTTTSFSREIVNRIYEPDFSASKKRVEPGIAVSGDVLTYTIEVESSNFAGGAISLLDALPAGLSFVADSLTYGTGNASYDPTTRTVNWAGDILGDPDRYYNNGTDYEWTDSDGRGAVSQTEFEWFDIADTGTKIGKGDYNYWCNVPIGFSFPFYDSTYSDFCVSTDGFISFGPKSPHTLSSTCSSSDPFDNGEIIAVVWDDLVVDDNIRFQVFGSAPSRSLVVQWSDIRPYNSSSRVADHMQVILREDGEIVMQVLTAGSLMRSESYTGIQSTESQKKTVYTCHERNKLHDNLAVRFLPPGNIQGSAQSDLSFQVQVDDNVAINSQLVNTAQINASRQEIDRSASVQINTLDLSTSGIIVDSSEIRSGEQVRFSYTLRNIGQWPARNATLKLTLPESLGYVENSLACNIGQCRVEADKISWTGEIRDRDPVSLVFAVALVAPVPDRTTLTMIATLNDGYGNRNTLQTSLIARRSDLSRSFTEPSNQYVEPGTQAAIRLYLHNTGGQETDATATITFPALLRIVEGSLTCGSGDCAIVGNKVEWSGALQERALVQIRLLIELPADAVYGESHIYQVQVSDKHWDESYDYGATIHVSHNRYLPYINMPGDSSEVIAIPLFAAD